MFRPIDPIYFPNLKRPSHNRHHSLFPAAPEQPPPKPSHQFPIPRRPQFPIPRTTLKQGTANHLKSNHPPPISFPWPSRRPGKKHPPPNQHSLRRSLRRHGPNKPLLPKSRNDHVHRPARTKKRNPPSRLPPRRNPHRKSPKHANPDPTNKEFETHAKKILIIANKKILPNPPPSRLLLPHIRIPGMDSPSPNILSVDSPRLFPLAKPHPLIFNSSIFTFNFYFFPSIFFFSSIRHHK